MVDLRNDEMTQSMVAFICAARNLCVADIDLPRAMGVIGQRMNALDISNCESYKDHLQAHPHEYNHFLDAFYEEKGFLVNEPIWHDLKHFYSTRLQNNDHSQVRIWVIGCGKGDEAVGASMAFADLMGATAASRRLKIFATDIDEAKLAIARQSTYSKDYLMRHLAPNMVSKYFSGGDKSCALLTELRRTIIFGKHDVARDPSIFRMDLIVCRQVLPRLNHDIQMRIGGLLLDSLQDGGFLVLGEHERLSLELEAQTVSELPQVYQKNVSRIRNSRGRKEQPVYANGDSQSTLLEAAFDACALATLCVDMRGTVASANAQARALFNLYPQDIGKPLQDLELSYRPIELRSLIEVSYRENREVVVNRVVRHSQHNQPQIFDVYIRPLFNGKESLGAAVQFKEASARYGLQEELLSLNQQLQTANEELQSAHEELETTNEELHSTNEELETTNEELQSSNEELETMNEELQSTNTELEFSNNGQRELLGAVDHINAFLESILASMRSAVVVTNTDGKIVVWNERCVALWGLRQDEVKDQPLLALDIGLPLKALKQPLRRIEDKKSDYEELSIEAINRLGKPISCCVRIMPLSSAGGNIVLIDEEKQRSS